MVLGSKIKKLREGRGLSLREAAAYIYGKTGVNMDFTTIRNIEEGKTPDVHPEKVAAIAAAYGVGVSDISRDPVLVAKGA